MSVKFNSHNNPDYKKNEIVFDLSNEKTENIENTLLDLEEDKEPLRKLFSKDSQSQEIFEQSFKEETLDLIKTPHHDSQLLEDEEIKRIQR